jgi:hypothetical protein
VRITFGEPIAWEEISSERLGESLGDLLRRNA